MQYDLLYLASAYPQNWTHLRIKHGYVFLLFAKKSMILIIRSLLVIFS